MRISRTCEGELQRPSYEEREAISPQDAETMELHAHWLQGQCNAAEDRDALMIKVSIRLARVIAKGLVEGAASKRVEHG